METISPDILRAIITDIMLLLFIFTMSTPKYTKKHVYVVSSIIIIVLNLIFNIFFYMTKNYSAVVVVDILMLGIVAISIKPLFQETMIQWGFIFITLLNIYAAIIFLSYFLCDIFPNPYYGNTLLRALMFAIIVVVFWKIAGPLYHKVKEYWYIFYLLTGTLLINYLYYFLSGDIEQALTEHFMSILLLVFLTVFIYLGILLSLKIIIQRYELNEKAARIESERLLLQNASNEMKQRLSIMEDAVKQMRISQHDRRHFNATIKELIENGETKQALLLLNKYSAELPQSPRYFCENVEVNAAVSYYAAMAHQKGINCDMKLNIPKDISIDGLELAMVVSNLFENAIEGVMSVTDENTRSIKFNSMYTGQLLLEIENTYVGKIKTDENGFPISQKEDHGIGTQSVICFAKKWNAELDYYISDNTFKVQMMI
jgi:signal transduction histidine kinase